jgi:ppGpp synthetase/RelA/SpoT-type nucleotidyltranferase
MIDHCLKNQECEELGVGWVEPIYSRSDVNKAGKFLVNNIESLISSIISRDEEFDRQLDHHFDVFDNFRAAHAFPLNTLQIRLRAFTASIDQNGIVAQRLKRLSSILYKLGRFPTMELWDMQDIGGCRAIVASVGDVFRIEELFRESSIKHKLAHYDNYILEPRESGYRGVHLIYRYLSDKKSQKYNGMKIEIQLRTPIQHAWATAVETVDLFTKQALKSSAGKPQWERFFQLMGTIMAFRENTSPVRNTPTNMKELTHQLKECADELQVIKTLRGFTTALNVTRAESAKYRDAAFYLLSLDSSAEQLNITGFRHGESKEASEAYAEQESQIRTGKTTNDAVLVSVDSIRNLERAYPNYFADTKTFVEQLERTLNI